MIILDLKEVLNRFECFCHIGAGYLIEIRRSQGPIDCEIHVQYILAMFRLSLTTVLLPLVYLNSHRLKLTYYLDKQRLNQTITNTLEYSQGPIDCEVHVCFCHVLSAVDHSGCVTGPLGQPQVGAH